MSAGMALFGTVAAYVALAVLLLSLNVASLWSWRIKAGAIVVSAIVFAAAYLAISGMSGWPAPGPLPQRFQLLAARIAEPDTIYLWVEELDGRNLPVAAPRAFELPYSVTLATETDKAQAQIDAGIEVIGRVVLPEQMRGDAVEVGQEGFVENVPNLVGGSAVVVFSDMPPADLPDKAAASGE